jgi:nitrogen fixation/metabolism regulation signal transduction histidine kinase
MFKTIERTLMLLALALVAATAGAAWLFAVGKLFWGFVASCAVLWLLGIMRRENKKFNSNVIFLLNALENGDYSFGFAGAADMSPERRDVNTILNVIKEMLVRAREQEIENEKFLSLIVAAIPVGIVIVDGRGFVKVANDAALKLLGLPIFTHTKQLAMIDDGILQAFRSVAPRRGTTIRIADEREERLISLGVSAIRTNKDTLRVFTMHNIAGELEEREMESWIKLIRVMTHEIMNSIAPITSLSETMGYAWAHPAESPDGEEKLRRNTMEAFATITSTARGLLSFVESYRRFTGIPKPDLRPVALGPFIENMVNLEKPMLRERGIEITTPVDDPDITVAADEGQIGQVLVNLLKNAAEAIEPGRTDGKIEVHVWRGRNADGGFENSDRAVHIDVIDNGAPIPEDVLPHIFVPFFTTKDSGSGIGLSVSRYIMRLHGGNLKHRTEDGRTIFSMIFS